MTNCKSFEELLGNFFYRKTLFRALDMIKQILKYQIFQCIKFANISLCFIKCFCFKQLGNWLTVAVKSVL